MILGRTRLLLTAASIVMLWGAAPWSRSTAETKSGGMDTNESFSYKFDKPGTYHFTCSIHPRMVGTIVVE
jgi:plastocyanin